MHTLLLGPVLGHTDTGSTRVWIRVQDDPANYRLRIRGIGTVPFVPLEITPEFGTAQARFEGMAPDTEYRYQVLRRGRPVAGARGRVRTMPDAASMTPVRFAFVSCNKQSGDGAWRLLARQVERARPHFLVMMGDQVYVDQEGGIFKSHRSRPQAERRSAIAAKYQDNWSRPLPRRVMAQVPTYMVWDDHEIRDGWGSWASDSSALAAIYPKGRKIFDRNDAYFRDARDVYLQFQMPHNPTTLRPQGSERRAMPFFIRCGRMALLVLDGRGDRDVFRAELPVLGAAQWEWIDETLAALDSGVDALAIVTPAPIAIMGPRSAGPLLLGPAQPDLRMFRRGDGRGLDHLIDEGNKVQKVMDEVRDQWAHRASRPEQARLLRAAAAATRVNRGGLPPRTVSFLGGDIHMAARFTLTVRRPRARMQLAVSSGISQVSPGVNSGGFTVDQDFRVASDIHAHRTEFLQSHNYGWFEMVPTGGTPQTVITIAHAGRALGASAQAGRASR